MTQEEPKIQIDSDWKAEAQAEKERLEKEEQTQAEREPGHGPGELPPADFRALVGTLASQAIMGLGAFGDQKTGRVVIDLGTARFSIDLLSVLEEKTKGNISEEEALELTQTLAELRARFVHISNLVAQQSVAEAAGKTAVTGEQPQPPVGG
ncbi:MAG: DUF1844 domain-containing protein [Planctomycetota bacterium]|jgi:predicted deacylase